MTLRVMSYDFCRSRKGAVRNQLNQRLKRPALELCADYVRRFGQPALSRNMQTGRPSSKIDRHTGHVHVMGG